MEVIIQMFVNHRIDRPLEGERNDVKRLLLAYSSLKGPLESRKRRVFCVGQWFECLKKTEANRVNRGWEYLATIVEFFILGIASSSHACIFG